MAAERYQGADRRVNPDPRMEILMKGHAHLHGCVELLKKEMERNTVVTEQVRDILASFRVVGAIAKWCAAIGAGATAVYHGWLFWRS